MFPGKLEVLAGALSGHVTSPNFPSGYPLRGEVYTYELQNLDPRGYIRLWFDDWNLSNHSAVSVCHTQNLSNHCNYKFVQSKHNICKSLSHFFVQSVPSPCCICKPYPEFVQSLPNVFKPHTESVQSQHSICKFCQEMVLYGLKLHISKLSSQNLLCKSSGRNFTITVNVFF